MPVSMPCMTSAQSSWWYFLPAQWHVILLPQGDVKCSFKLTCRKVCGSGVYLSFWEAVAKVMAPNILYLAAMEPSLLLVSFSGFK